MDSSMKQDLRQIERREWQLWMLTLALLMAFMGVTVGTYSVILNDSSRSPEIDSVAGWALPGLVVLITLFCVYVIHTRVLFGKMRRFFEKQAMRDTLTGLFNRQYFADRMGEEIARADRKRSTVAVLLCDLDHFKIVNDTRGHQAGDEVLKEAAEAIQDATRGSDLVFRWGGDEILVVLSDTAREGILKAADRIRQGVRSISESAQLDLDVSIGVALYPEHSGDIEGLIRLADRALYIAKKGGDHIHIGQEEYRLDEKAIRVVFQAVVDIRSKAILGYEALSRDPEGKLGILELFRRYEAVGQLDELKCMCVKLQIAAARKAGLNRVFINVDFKVLEQIETISKPPGIEIIFEISEAEALLNVEKHLKTTSRWRAQGYKFAIDDFGAGFTSLPFIARLVPDFIKMDRSTIVQAASSQQFMMFLRDLILALRNYSKEGIIAEGIETEKELEVVKLLGIDPVQGFFVSEPKEMN